MISQDSMLRDPVLYVCIIGVTICIIGLAIIFHDPFVQQEAMDKTTINWIDSQKECNQLQLMDNMYGTHNKWFKDKTDLELIKKMKELKC